MLALLGSVLALGLRSVVGGIAYAQTGNSPSDSCLTSTIAALPLIERPAPSGAGPLTLLLTGDGGWAKADAKVADGLVARGSPVLGVNMRSYLNGKRSPDQVAFELQCVARTYMERWQRERILLLGYSRGADIAPFVAARWPADLRERVNLVALVAMSRAANFRFHLLDLVHHSDRADDIPIAPELERLRGLNVICVYGVGDADTGCSDADSTVVRRFARPGGHRMTGGFDAIVDLIAPSLTAR